MDVIAVETSPHNKGISTETNASGGINVPLMYQKKEWLLISGNQPTNVSSNLDSAILRIHVSGSSNAVHTGNTLESSGMV